ncbi:MAG TPA: hypothetical protein VF487_07990 [Chitinophagaceae bacterium]
MSKTQLEKKYSKMNSPAILSKIMKGNMGKKEATVAANVAEKRFPTPLESRVK